MVEASILDLCFEREVRRSKHLLSVSSSTRLNTSSMPSSSKASSKAFKRLAIFCELEGFDLWSERSKLGLKSCESLSIDFDELDAYECRFWERISSGSAVGNLDSHCASYASHRAHLDCCRLRNASS